MLPKPLENWSTDHQPIGNGAVESAATFAMVADQVDVVRERLDQRRGGTSGA
jgi:hypothetical protein